MHVDSRVLGVSLTVLMLGLSGSLGPGAGRVAAQDRERFHVEWESDVTGGVDPVVRGFVDNRSTVRVADVRLRIDTLDASGTVVGQSFGWVFGDLPAGGRAYFVIPVAVTGVAYRVSVQSFDPISAGPEIRGGGVPGPPSASPATGETGTR